MVILRAGQLRHRVKLQSATETQDSYGAIVQTWADVATVWASIEARTGRETFTAAQVYATADHIITIRYRSGVTAKMRIVYGSRVFDIQGAVDPDGRKRTLMIYAKEAV